MCRGWYITFFPRLYAEYAGWRDVARSNTTTLAAIDARLHIALKQSLKTMCNTVVSVGVDHRTRPRREARASSWTTKTRPAVTECPTITGQACAVVHEA